MTQPNSPNQPPHGYTAQDIERRHVALDPDDKGRDRFQRDHDRLIHAPSLRRLQGKTQVLTPGEADFFRTRLTHSLEVAQVARRLAQNLGANRDLCEAAALLHDLGHPPFAHVGEQTLSAEVDKIAKAWGVDKTADVGGFNGNAQSFRLAVKSLSHKQGFAGLDLTRGVLDGAIKYPWQRNDPNGVKSNKRWCFYPTESDDAAWVRDGVPQGRKLQPSFEAQIVEWADDVAYSIHDVEDWYRAGFMPLELIVQSDQTLRELARQIAADVATGPFDAAEAEKETIAFFKSPTFRGITNRYDGSVDAKHGIHILRANLFDEFVGDVSIADPSKPASRHNNDLVVAPKARLHSRILKELLTVFVLEHPRMATYEVGQAHVIRSLFGEFVTALDFDPASQTFGERSKLTIFPHDTRGKLDQARSNPAELLRLVADHIAGMTDGYAIRLQERLSGVGIGSFNEFV